MAPPAPPTREPGASLTIDATPLRAWQAEAIEKYEAEAPDDFLVTATPGAGKTTFGLALASRLWAARVIDRIIVVAPTDHLRTQWADAAVRSGLLLDPNLTNGVGRIRDREALADGVVRPVVFAAYAGTSRWMNSAGEVLAADLGEGSTRALEDAAWRTALNPAGAWVPHVIAAIDDRISHLRDTGMPDAAGLLLASDQEAARAYADLVKKITGEKPVVILSDDPRASKRIFEFGRGQHRMAVCVRMVSEGVDIPRAAVLGFLTSYRTPLFFAQAVGRVVRARNPRETATVFLPAVRPLLSLAADLEVQRDHVVRISGPASDDLDALEPPEDPADELTAEGEFTPLTAEAAFAHVLHAGKAITGEARPRAEAEDYLGFRTAHPNRPPPCSRRATSSCGVAPPGLAPDPARPAAVVVARGRGAAQGDQRPGGAGRRPTGRKHADVHGDLRRAVPGPRTASASIEVLLARRDHLLSDVR